MTHLLLTLVMAWTVAATTNHREALFILVVSGWANSVFLFDQVSGIPFRRMLAGVLTSGVLAYLLCKFILD